MFMRRIHIPVRARNRRKERTRTHPLERVHERPCNRRRQRHSINDRAGMRVQRKHKAVAAQPLVVVLASVARARGRDQNAAVHS